MERQNLKRGNNQGEKNRKKMLRNKAHEMEKIKKNTNKRK